MKNDITAYNGPVSIVGVCADGRAVIKRSYDRNRTSIKCRSLNQIDIFCSLARLDRDVAGDGRSKVGQIRVAQLPWT
ncbi:hypothetical protein D3C74_423170 [compost metagenome]